MTLTNQRLRAPTRVVASCVLALAVVGGCGSSEEPSTEGGSPVQGDIELGSLSQELNLSPLTPVLTCVDNLGGNAYKAHFGFVNTSSRTLQVPVGLLNFFVPLPLNQGQPTSFAPGQHLDVFRVNFSVSGGWNRLAWWLGARRALATKNTPLCPQAPECTTPAECDDDDPCTNEACVSGSCSRPPAPSGTTCGHAGVCDGAGECVKCVTNAGCDDEFPCTNDVCSGGECVYPPAASGTTCGHSGSCDGAGTCVAPACSANEECDDEDPCTTEVCNATACDYSPSAAGIACGHAGLCNGAGECVECLSAADCDDELPCTADVCTGGSCSHPPAASGTPCGHAGTCDGSGTCEL